jgi:hypothetical protein
MKADSDRWLIEHSKVSVTLPDRPAGDWRDEPGYGWILKVWFRTWRQSRAASDAIRDAGWDAKFWGRKLRVTVSDGYDGQKLGEFILDRWPDVRGIQLRCD